MSTIATKPRSLLGPDREGIEDQSSHPFWSIGFRPFFLMASLSAVVLVPIWLAILHGAQVPAYFTGTVLHAHEMLFGFTVAVIAGFLLTAGANWTRRATTRAGSLAQLAALWLLARIALITPGVPKVFVLAVDVAFLPSLALVLGSAIFRSHNWRNLPFVGMLALLTLSNSFMHAEAWAEPGSLAALVRPGLGQNLAVHTISLMLVVMGGRVIPMFTRNATKVESIERNPILDRFAVSAFLVAALVDLVSPTSALTGPLWLLTGGLHVWRMKSWGTRHARAPLLWILHAGYGSVALSFILRGCAQWGWVPASSALHLLTVGGIGGLCLGMMTRVSLGHSGRLLVAPRSMTVAFALWAVATVIRAGGPIVPGIDSFLVHVVSGIAWTGAYLVLLTFGIPIWFSPRVDTIPGAS